MPEKFQIPDVVRAPRTDPIYNAHGYLTKVPVDAIIPYLESLTEPGDLVVDPFAGSGMTAIAAKITGRNAIVSDISHLGRHIASGYLAEVNEVDIRSASKQVLEAARKESEHLYKTIRQEDGSNAVMVRTVWSYIYECSHCSEGIVFYKALERNSWRAPSTCYHCEGSFSKKGAKYISDAPLIVVVKGANGKQVEQEVARIDLDNIALADETRPSIPSLEIAKDREMYKRSALEKWGYRATSDFFSGRNAHVLKSIWQEIVGINPPSVRQKLLFAFTAILPRASKRYQWSKKRPLNAANQNYYVAPVFYEWNVFELFERKVEAIIRADKEILSRQHAYGVYSPTEQKYEICSADKLRYLGDNSVDLVFADPPFGSNIFYSDMSLFQEAWLDGKTDATTEAVIHTTGTRKNGSAERYESLIVDALAEAYRVLKPGGHLCLVFGNSKGSIWSMVQNGLAESGFGSTPRHIAILDKGQRSVKGLNSGFESVATLDLIVTVQKTSTKDRETHIRTSLEDTSTALVQDMEVEESSLVGLTSSHIYLSVLKEAMSNGISVTDLHLSDIEDRIEHLGLVLNKRTGRLEQFVSD